MLTEPLLYTAPTGGITYKVEGLTQKVQDAFERYIQNQALQLIREAKDQLAPGDYLDLMREHLFKAKNRKYVFGSPDCSMHMQIPEHFVELMWYCFSKYQMLPKQKMQELFDKDPEGILQLFEEIVSSKKGSGQTAGSCSTTVCPSPISENAPIENSTISSSC